MKSLATIRLITSTEKQTDRLVHLIQDIARDHDTNENGDTLSIPKAYDIDDELTAYYITTDGDFLTDKSLRSFIRHNQAHIIITPEMTYQEIDDIIADDIKTLDSIDIYNQADTNDPHIHTITLNENLDEETATLDNGTTIKPLPIEYQNGYAGKYYAGNDGEIYSTKRNNTHTLAIGDTMHRLLFSDNGRGYLIAFNNKTQHELIAAAWIGPRPDGYEIDHIDGNPKNNKPSNLEYVTPFENKYRALVNTHKIGTYHPFKDAPDYNTRNIFDKKPKTWRELDCPTTPHGFKTITNGNSYFDNNTRRTALLIDDEKLTALIEQIQQTPGFISYELNAYNDQTDIAIEYNTTDSIVIVTNRILQIAASIDKHMHLDIDTISTYCSEISVDISVRY